MITVDKEDEDGLILNAMHSIQVQHVWIEIYILYFLRRDYNYYINRYSGAQLPHITPYYQVIA